MTQSQIAAEVGCGQSTVSDMAAGKVGTARPSFKTVSGIQRLAAKHQIPIEPEPPPAHPARKRLRVPD